jgi:hypothetical protein
MLISASIGPVTRMVPTRQPWGALPTGSPGRWLPTPAKLADPRHIETAQLASMCNAEFT